MSKIYRVLIAGMGKRGLHHASAFSKNPRFEVAAISDPVPAQLEKAKALYPKAQAGADAGALARESKPDIFCFCTPPHIRLPLIKTGLESGAKLIAYEKPMAMLCAQYTSMSDRAVQSRCSAASSVSTFAASSDQTEESARRRGTGSPACRGVRDFRARSRYAWYLW